MKTNLLTHITEERLPMLLVALNRALNTWDDAPRWLFTLADALQAGDVTTDTLWAANTLSTYGVNADGKLVISAHGYSADPLGAWQTMEAALDFVEAIKQRNVDITPEQLYRALVGRDYQVKPMAEGIVIGNETQHVATIEEDEFPLPEWAECHVEPHVNGYLAERAQLMTKDGRRCGNAVVVGAKMELSEWAISVLTDMGNRLILSYAEIEELFYPPKYILKPDAIGVRQYKGVTCVTIANVTDEQLDAMQQAAWASHGSVFEELSPGQETP